METSSLGQGGAVAAPTFRRAVSRWQLVAIAVNGVVGSGVYLLPASAAALLGPASVLAVAGAGLAVFFIVLCFAEAASHFEEPGSAYLYTRTAFGELAGFQVGWMAWLARVATVASLSAGFAQAVTFLWPAAKQGWGQQLAVALPLLLLTAVNLAGINHSAWLTVGLTVGKLLPLAFFLAVALPSMSMAVWESQPPGAGELTKAAMLLLFAYAGFENTAAAAGEFKNPRRDIPFALLTQVLAVMAIYLAVQVAALGTLPELGASPTPLAAATTLLVGAWGGILLTLGAAISILGTSNNSVIAGPRYLYALAADGFGPRFLAKLHPRWQTPAAAILFQTAVVLPLALAGTFEELAALSVITRLFTYVGTCAAVPVLRRQLPPRPGAFRLPGGPLIPGVAVALALAFAASASVLNLVAAAVAILIGLAIYALRRPVAGSRESSSG